MNTQSQDIPLVPGLPEILKEAREAAAINGPGYRNIIRLHLGRNGYFWDIDFMPADYR
jgi:hypothetical protein